VTQEAVAQAPTERGLAFDGGRFGVVGDTSDTRCRVPQRREQARQGAQTAGLHDLGFQRVAAVELANGKLAHQGPLDKQAHEGAIGVVEV
jgi:hypothetical protein